MRDYRDARDNKVFLENTRFIYRTNFAGLPDEKYGSTTRYANILIPDPDIAQYDRTKEEFDKIRKAEERKRRAEAKKRAEARKPKYEPGSEEQREAQLRAIRRNIAKSRNK